MSEKSLRFLVVPTGSGKSYIGELLERRLGILFFRVEPVFMDIRRDLAPDDPGYSGKALPLSKG